MAQSVVNTDVLLLVKKMPAPPVSLQEAYTRVYPGDAAYAEPRTFYQTTFQKLQQPYEEGQELLKAFYLKYPNGMAPAVPSAHRHRLSDQQENAMNTATAELVQKIRNDPAFAQQFARMSEAEQQACIAKFLADNGIKPVEGKATASQNPVPGMDIDWMKLCQEYTSAAASGASWSRQSVLREKYADEHAAINHWVEAEIQQLPMISFGEYGHDHDPEKVKAIRKKGMEKHRQSADAMMKELNVLFTQIREEAQQISAPLQQALQHVQYGKTYDFGIHYSLVLQTQLQMIGAAQTILENEIKGMEEVAQWEKEARIMQ